MLTVQKFLNKDSIKVSDPQVALGGLILCLLIILKVYGIICLVIKMKTYKIYFVKHGLIEGNLTGKYIGKTDALLIPEGLAMLNAMKEQYVYPPVDEYFTSPLMRCKQTMAALYPEAEPIVVPELAEYNFGDFEGKTAKELADNEDYIKWISPESAQVSAPNGENTEEFTTRVCMAFNSIVQYMMSNNKREAVICTHGGVISTILATYGFPQRTVSEWDCVGGKGYCIQVTPTIWMREGMFEIIGLFPFVKD